MSNTLDNKATVSVLNDLIETSRDGEAGYRKCAERATKPQLKALLTSRAGECAQAVSELTSMVLARDGKPEDDTSLAGDMHRGWTAFKASVAGDDDKAVLEECERGEDVAKKNYKKALEKDLPPDVRAVVQRQYDGVLRHHDEAKLLRDRERAIK